jgi:hypothetical protein
MAVVQAGSDSSRNEPKRGVHQREYSHSIQCTLIRGMHIFRLINNDISTDFVILYFKFWNTGMRYKN